MRRSMATPIRAQHDGPLARASGRFFACVKTAASRLLRFGRFDVATYVEGLQGAAAAPSVKQELAAIRMLFAGE